MGFAVTLLAALLLVLGLVTPAQPARDRGASAPATLGSAININTATVEQLMTLSGIGRRVAEQIVEDRQSRGRFTKPEELQRVRGVGKGLFERNRKRIVVD